MKTLITFTSKAKFLPLAALSLLLPTLALAGGKATLVTTDQPMQMEGQARGPSTMTLTWRDAKTLRMDVSEAGGGTYLIMRDGKTYSVSQNNGQPIVMDMSAMGGLVKSMLPKGGDRDHPFGSIDSIKDTNTKETVAGIEGKVYQMQWTDPDGSKQAGEAVLTDDPVVVEMTHAYLGAMSAMVGDEYTRVYQDAMPKDNKGLLKVGEQFYVESISSAEPPASSFELPAEPMDMRNLMEQMGKMAQ
ncbi:hypothetical protein [Oceanisphaera avium]|uniref:DUF4412 domain-containing protein n=1 Tax=Oceanisphaera avium TaxID=1903694 RepID=A0A1Y0CYH7_9GAMM|nr:hypothetical protein [Oceanisphaera avium]ART80381.1 hypothetical protein CBP12_09685 [Oceanisphaera avium]